MENKQIRDALSVMQPLNITPINLPGTPVRLLVFATQKLPLVISRSILVKASGGGRGEKMLSFHIDLHAGRKKSEVDFLKWAIVRMAKKFRIDSPLIIKTSLARPPITRLLNHTIK
jgi:2-dehydropantoate 2-reductase